MQGSILITIGKHTGEQSKGGIDVNPCIEAICEFPDALHLGTAGGEKSSVDFGAGHSDDTRTFRFGKVLLKEIKVKSVRCIRTADIYYIGATESDDRRGLAER